MFPIEGYKSVGIIPRVHNITPDVFERDYYSKQLPVIITGRLATWRAMSEWTPEGIKALWPDAVLHASLNLPVGRAPGHYKWSDHTRWMKVSEFVDAMATATSPCYMRQAPSEKLAGFEDFFDFGTLMDIKGREPKPNLWFGSTGTDSGLHWDAGMNFLAQIYGSKQIVLFAPGDTRNIYPFPDQIRWSGFNAIEPDFDAYPRARRASPITGVLGPGEAIFMPPTWWHQVRSLDAAISINCFFRPECSTAAFLAASAKTGVRSLATLARDFVWLGMFGKPYQARMFADVPTGLYLYNLFVSAWRRRLKRGPPRPATTM